MNHTDQTPPDSFRAMRKLLVAVSVAFASCSVETNDKAEGPLPEQSILSDNPHGDRPHTATETIQDSAAAQTVSTDYLAVQPRKAKDGVQQVAYKVRPEVIESLNKIIPAYDTAQYNNMTVSYFTSLAHELNGRPFFVVSSDSLMEAITEILSSRLNDGTDIVFVIDKTASMDDDIENVKSGMKNILAYLNNFKNVKLGLAAYGDRNWHRDLWYNRIPLGYGTDKIAEFMNSFVTIGNPDVPESVNDAIVRTVDEMNWTPGNRRMMLVIGDAPSQIPPLSDYTQQQVVDKCRDNNITFNLYPIVLATGLSHHIDPVVRQGLTKIYPNPVNTALHLEASDDDFYSYVVNDLSGRKVRAGQFGSRNFLLPTADLSPGNYLVQVYNSDQSKFDSKLIIVKH